MSLKADISLAIVLLVLASFVPLIAGCGKSRYDMSAEERIAANDAVDLVGEGVYDAVEYTAKGDTVIRFQDGSAAVIQYMRVSVRVKRGDRIQVWKIANSPYDPYIRLMNPEAK